jgi:hypothetical protein
MIYLAFVTHDTVSNTLEATWFEKITDTNGVVQSLKPVKCRNYPADQKADFLADCGTDGAKYVAMAGW